MRKNTQTLLVLTILIASTVTWVYAVQPEEPRLPVLVQNILDILRNEPIRYEVVLERFTDNTTNMYAFVFECDKEYELEAVYLKFTDSNISTPYSIHNLGISHISEGKGFQLGSVRYHEIGDIVYDHVTSAEILSATGVSMHLPATEGSAFEVRCTLWEPMDLGFATMPDGTESMYLKIVIVAPPGAEIVTLMYPTIPT
jgi:hypothetical protein